ncbi:sporulation protein YjcZ [Marseilla massiliensis]|uniref:Sporulation protein YjcZ n=1 Tax=Marseilla massiliensis TaxID=1841864 RepID=A0A939B811_9BACT|nr:sporulation protein YjcZ [Marseilla massiliensis]
MKNRNDKFSLILVLFILLIYLRQ